MNRYHSDKFTGQYKATIGADFVSKQLILPVNSGNNTGSMSQSVTLTIWDTAGQERFQSLGKAFYRGSDVCVLVYDVTDRISFEGLRKWKEEFDSCLNGGSINTAIPGGMLQNRLQNGNVVGEKLRFIVIANKADKDYHSWSVAREEGIEYAKSISSEFFECSAKTALNVEQAFLSAAKAGLEYNAQKQLSMNASMMMQGSNGGMRGYVPPQRTVDLNRGQSSVSDEGDCC
jgi:Ras-related protein Rab-7A